MVSDGRILLKANVRVDQDGADEQTVKGRTEGPGGKGSDRQWYEADGQSSLHGPVITAVLG